MPSSSPRPEAVEIFPDLGFYPHKFTENVAERLARFRIDSRGLTFEILESPVPAASSNAIRLVDAISATCEDLLIEALFRYEFVLEKIPLDDFRLEWVDGFVESIDSLFHREFAKLASQIPGMKLEPDPVVLARTKARWLKCAAVGTDKALEYCRIAPGSIHNEQEMALMDTIRRQIAAEDAGEEIIDGTRFEETMSQIKSPPNSTEVPVVLSAPSFPLRGAWFADRLYERGWDKHELERRRGPAHKTTQKVLDGLAVRTDVLGRIAEALSTAPKFAKVTTADFPRK